MHLEQEIRNTDRQLGRREESADDTLGCWMMYPAWRWWTQAVENNDAVEENEVEVNNESFAVKPFITKKPSISLRI